MTQRIASIALLVVVAAVGACSGSSATPPPARPEARTDCERAFSAMAYFWDDNGEHSDPLTLAMFAACTPDEFESANERFQVLRGYPFDYQDHPVDYQDPHDSWNTDIPC